ncbi:MAG TPA: MBL fold metallo-hydrolase [Candidatus Binatia bacterium]|jgi:ribonuclease Z|nr:MBL fold metallo-hydrolase [Candidatus Binatia bacterium]
MFEVVFLGTSASTPSAYRGLTAHVVMYRQYRFLLDCGEGTQRQILLSGLGFKGLNRILLTHSHLDHILGLGGLLSTLARWEALEDIEIYGGQAALDRVADLIYRVVWRGHRPPVQISLIPLQPHKVLLEDERFTLSAFPVSHRGPDSFGFLFREKSRRPFLPEKAEALGVPFGPERGRLVRGQAVTLADGRTVQPEQVLGEEIPGTSYVHVGDVGRTDNLLDVCRGASALTIESTYVDEEADLARNFGHLTAAQAARLARDADVQALILTHLSRRYYGHEVRSEARSIFPNAYVARDFDHFQVTRSEVKRLQNRAHGNDSDS